MKNADFIHFRDKVIVITGASSGIGLASARYFYSCGARLALAARRLELLKEEVSHFAGSGNAAGVLCVRADVSVEGDCRNLIEETVRKFGRIDVLINNAGLSMRAMFKDLDLSVLKRLMDTNFWGTVYCTKYALPHLLASKGSVVGVVSTAAFAGLPARTGYSASKFAIRGFLNTLRLEHIYDGLHVLVFAPGYTRSNVRVAALTDDGSPQGESPRDEGKMMSAEKVARYLAKGIRRRKSEMILTFIGKLDVLLYKWFPRITDRFQVLYVSKEPDSPFKSRPDAKEFYQISSKHDHGHQRRCPQGSGGEDSGKVPSSE